MKTTQALGFTSRTLDLKKYFAKATFLEKVMLGAIIFNTIGIASVLVINHLIK